jgi:ketosteroid isomerase-like protein
MTVREAFERGTDTFNAHDIDGFAAVLAENVVFEAPGIRGEGKAACSDFYRTWFFAFPDAQIEVNSLHILGDIIVEEGTFTGTHKALLPSPSGDISPTGRSVRLDYIQVIHFRDGKHSSFHLVFDRLLMLEQLGLMPAPALAT